jgi:RNA polymerase sigma factor (sigma-70 family)
MPSRVSGTALVEIQKLLDCGAMWAWTDHQLIERFLARQEESDAAFRLLIQRHGPMVLGVCRRILGDEHAAEDAFQATFLILIKKAGRLRDPSLLTNWLYGVALRVSQKERARSQRRRHVERHVAEQALRVAGVPEPGELQAIIDEEIRRLPERYRLPVLLCHVEGLRHDEAARRLGCPVGTVESRLSRAREQLRARLARRGLAPTGSAMAALLGPMRVSPVPTSLVESTLHAVAGRLTVNVSLLATARALAGRAGRAATGMHMGIGAAVTGLVISMGIAAAGRALFLPDKSEPTPTAPVTAPAKPKPQSATSPSVARAAERLAVSPIPRRMPQAIALPMSGITIDGRLDDWPQGLTRYLIRQHLTSMPDSYRTELPDDRPDFEADFRVGYDPKAGLIYLAVVVRDNEHVTQGRTRNGPGGQVYETDSGEVYIDSAFSNRKIAIPAGDWREELDAATMPVLQYVGIAAEVPAYSDPRGANPSLVYARVRERRTQMKYKRDEEAKTTTYEWAIQPYDRFPNVRTPLVAGRRIGLEVAVVDKNSGPTKPAFVTWGSPPQDYKGVNAGSLGELYLADGP